MDILNAYGERLLSATWLALLLPAVSVGSASNLRAIHHYFPHSDGAIRWNGDFETGNTKQYVSQRGVNADPPTVVRRGTGPVSEGQYSGRFHIYANQKGLARSEITTSQAQTGGYEGKAWFYTWQMYFPAGQTTWSNQWNGLVQWMDTRYQCSPPVSVGVSTPNEYEKTHYLAIYSQPLDNANHCTQLGPWHEWKLGVPKLNHWYTMTMLIRFSRDPRKGLIRAWLDRRQVLKATHVRTIDNGGDYLELHDYQGSPNGASTVYFDSARRHTCYALAPCVKNG